MTDSHARLNPRLILCTIIIFFLLFSSIGFNAYASSFSDINSTEWFSPNVDVLVEKGIINGYPDGTFKPSNLVNVDAFLKMVVTSLGYEIELDSNYWALGYISKAISLNLINPQEYTKYDVPITREQAAKIVTNALNNDSSLRTDFLSACKDYILDYDKINADYEKSVLKAFAHGIITGYPDKKFHPLKTLTRAEACTIIARILDEDKRKIPSLPYDIIKKYPYLDQKSFLDREAGFLKLETELVDNTKDIEQKLDVLDLELKTIEEQLTTTLNELKNTEPYIYPNGDYHYGNYDHQTDNYKGNTLFVLADGTTLLYTDYSNNSANGLGMIIWTDGDKYVGFFKDGKKHGKGKYVYGNGNQYIGNFSEGDFNGLGIYKYLENEKYVGSFSNDSKSGLGIYYFSNGNKYIGNFTNNLFNGEGIFISNNNENESLIKYIGHFKDDVQFGEGINYWADGSKFIGSYNDSIDDSVAGCYINSNGDMFIKNSVLTETIQYGKYYWKSGLVYVGLFDNQNNRLCKNPSYISNEFEEKAFEEKVDSILDEIIKDNMTDVQKERAIHNYIIKNTTYYEYKKGELVHIPDYCHTAYGVLMFGTGVCDGYAEAVNILLNKCSIESKLIFGYPSNIEEITDDTIGHAWNLVKIDDIYYHLDVTWDDPDKKNKILYDYFNLTEDEIRKTHQW